MTRRLVGLYLALTLLVLAALEIPLAISYRDRQLDQLEAGLERDGFVLSAFVEDTLVGDARSGLDQAGRDQLALTVANYAAQTEGRAVIVDRSGAVLADSDPAVDEPGRDFSSRPEIASALRREVAVGTRRSDTLDTDLVYVAVPVASGDEVLGAVRISYSTDQLDDRVHRYWALLGGAAVVTLLTAAVAGVLLARWVTRPLASLRTAAERIGDGDLGARAAPGEGPPEVQALARSFNTTAARLATLVRAQEQFVADASHQLRTPLAALRLRLEVLEDDTDDEASADLEAARNEVQRLSRLVDGLLALARAERSAAPTAPEPIVPAEVLEERHAAWQPLAAERGVRLELGRGADPRGDGPALRGLADPDRLGQAVDNLVANAVEFAPEGTSVELAVVRGAEAGTVEVHVTDHGPGLDEAQRAHAFDRFWRATSTRSELSGSGIGLAIVEKLVTADGGRAELRDTPGGGLDAVLVLRARA